MVNPLLLGAVGGAMHDVAAVVLALTACLPAQSWADQQLPDGRWPELPRTTDAIEAGLDPGQHAGDLRATATAVLADLAEGSTLKAGPRKDALKLAVSWMRDQIDADTGRFRAGSLDDHALGAYAVAATYAFSQYRTLKPYAAKTTAEVWRRIEEPKPGTPVNPATYALALLASEASGGLDAGARARALAWLDARPLTDQKTSLRHDAAELMCRVVAKPETAAADTVRLVDRFLTLQPGPRGEPPLDELTLFLATHALTRLGEPAWSAWSTKLTPLAQTSVDWSATPVGETGLRLVTLSLYYRAGTVWGAPGTLVPPNQAPDAGSTKKD